MTVKLACEHGVFIPEARVRTAIQYAAGRNQYCPIRRYLDQCVLLLLLILSGTASVRFTSVISTRLQRSQCSG